METVQKGSGKTVMHGFWNQVDSVNDAIAFSISRTFGAPGFILGKEMDAITEQQRFPCPLF